MNRFCVLLMFWLLMGLYLACDTRVEIAQNPQMPASSDGANAVVTSKEDANSDQPDAEAVLERSLATAKSGNKNVLVHIGAPW